jgi:hypothetical protein
MEALIPLVVALCTLVVGVWFGAKVARIVFLIALAVTAAWAGIGQFFHSDLSKVVSVLALFAAGGVAGPALLGQRVWALVISAVLVAALAYGIFYWMVMDACATHGACL